MYISRVRIIRRLANSDPEPENSSKENDNVNSNVVSCSNRENFKQKGKTRWGT